MPLRIQHAIENYRPQNQLYARIGVARTAALTGRMTATAGIGWLPQLHRWEGYYGFCGTGVFFAPNFSTEEVSVNYRAQFRHAVDLRIGLRYRLTKRLYLTGNVDGTQELHRAYGNIVTADEAFHQASRSTRMRSFGFRLGAGWALRR